MLGSFTDRLPRILPSSRAREAVRSSTAHPISVSREVLLFVVGVPSIAFEAYMVWSDRLGIRIGDIFADTQVVDAKVIAEAGALAGGPLPRAITPPPGPAAGAAPRVRSAA